MRARHRAVEPSAGGRTVASVMSRRSFMRLAAGAAALATAPARWGPQASAERPSVLFIIADGMRPVLGCYGDQVAYTPHIDRLAARGVRFTNAYCQAPLCGPSRSSLFTSLYPETIGIVDDVYRPLPDAAPHIPSMPRRFREGGWFTVQVANVFDSGNPDPGAWDLDIEGGRGFWSSSAMAARFGERPDRRVDRDAWRAWYRRVSTQFGPDERPLEEWPDYLAATRAIGVLAEPATSPVFVGVGFRATHVPLVAPAGYFGHYPAEQMPLPASFVCDPSGVPGRPALLRNNWELFVGACPDSGTARLAVRAYYACVSEVDDTVGRLLDLLDRLDLWDRMVVVFVSDHGFHLGERGLWSKQTPYDAACHVPLIIAAPGVGPGVSSEVVELLDLYPTLCGLCGVQVPPGCQGTSLLAALERPGAPRERAAYTVVGQPSSLVAARSVRTGRYRYVEWSDGTRELFDHATDPEEAVSLLRKPEPGPEPVGGLRQLLESLSRRAAPGSRASPAPESDVGH